MPALYPSMVTPESFKPGDAVRKFITEWNMTPFCGIVTHIIPSTSKVWVQWPIEHTQESPESLIKINPSVFGLPTSLVDRGYDSYEKSVSERNFGQGLPKRVVPSRDLPPFRVTATEKMSIRIAHTFSTNVIGKLVDDICKCLDNGKTDLQAYNTIFEKYGNYCSDHIIRSSIQKVYST